MFWNAYVDALLMLKQNIGIWLVFIGGGDVWVRVYERFRQLGRECVGMGVKWRAGIAIAILTRKQITNPIKEKT